MIYNNAIYRRRMQVVSISNYLGLITPVPPFSFLVIPAYVVQDVRGMRSRISATSWSLQQQAGKIAMVGT